MSLHSTRAMALAFCAGACSPSPKATEPGAKPGPVETGGSEGPPSDTAETAGSPPGHSGGDTASEPVDSDADGTPRDEGDCDDADPAVYPGAPEVCNGIDDDCDGLVDDADPDLPPQGYVDADGDGYAGTVSRTCVVDAEASSDCDDSDAAVHPEAAETCETEADDDCDGEANEEDALGCVAYSLDEDADGYGADTGGACLCAPVDAWTSTSAGDCDDGDADIHPEGRPCRFAGEYVLEEADAIYYGEVDGDGSGWSVAFAGDTDGDGADDVLISAHYEDSGGENSGAFYLLVDPPGGSHCLSSALAKGTGECAECYFGSALAGVGDADGDGYDDVLISEPDWPGTVDVSGGAVFLYLAPLSGALDVDDATLRMEGDGYTGHSVSGAGDQDGDGLLDLLIGAPWSSAGRAGRMSGRAYVASGAATGALDLADAHAVLDGVAASDYAGYRVSGGKDLDGDGLAELAVTAHGSDHPAGHAGSVYVVHGPVSGELSLGDADSTLEGEEVNDSFGTGLALVQDTDGDGNADLLAGSTIHADAGAAYLVVDPPAGTSSIADATARLDGIERGEWTGWAVSGAGDLDLDGYGEVLIGSWADRVSLQYGPVSGTISLGDADANWILESSGLAGYAVAGGGDVDADGLPDFLVGAPWAGPEDDGVGMSFLVLGSGS